MPEVSYDPILDSDWYTAASVNDRLLEIAEAIGTPGAGPGLQDYSVQERALNNEQVVSLTPLADYGFVTGPYVDITQNDIRPVSGSGGFDFHGYDTFDPDSSSAPRPLGWNLVGTGILAPGTPTPLQVNWTTGIELGNSGSDRVGGIIVLANVHMESIAQENAAAHLRGLFTFEILTGPNLGAAIWQVMNSTEYPVSELTVGGVTNGGTSWTDVPLATLILDTDTGGALIFGVRVVCCLFEYNPAVDPGASELRLIEGSLCVIPIHAEDMT